MGGRVQDRVTKILWADQLARQRQREVFGNPMSFTNSTTNLLVFCIQKVIRALMHGATLQLKTPPAIAVVSRPYKSVRFDRGLSLLKDVPCQGVLQSSPAVSQQAAGRSACCNTQLAKERPPCKEKPAFMPVIFRLEHERKSASPPMTYGP